MEFLGVETTGMMSDELALILKCMERQAKALEENRDALLLLDRRIEMLDSNVKSVADSVQTIAKRQSELEQSSEQRHMNCGEIIRVLTDRVSSIENDKTPIPRKFTPQEIHELYLGHESSYSDRDNGTSAAQIEVTDFSEDADDDGDEE